MKNPVASLIHFVVQSLRTTFRIRPEQPLRPSRARLSRAKSRDQQAVKEFRSMVLDMFSDPETLRLLLPHLVTAFPIQGGNPDTVGRIAKIVSLNPTTVGDSVAFEDSSGNVGIGTQSPGAKLHISTGSDIPANVIDPVLKIRQAFPGGGGAGDYKDAQIELGVGESVHARIEAGGAFSNNTPGHFLVKVADSTGALQNRLYIDPSGNVGIGTTDPASKLHVKDGNILSEASGDVRNLVLNQLSSSIKRTAISFRQQGNEQFVLGVDWNGANRPDFFLADGDGIKRFILLKPLGGTSDDQPQIQAAIDLLESYSPPGGIIHLSQGTYRIGSTLTIQASGVKLRGYGGGQPALGTSPTKLKWVAATTGKVVQLQSDTANTQIQDNEISDLAIDGDGHATFGLYLNRILKSKFISVDIYNMDANTGVGIKLTTDTSVADRGTHWNLFERCSVYNGKDGVVLTKESGAEGNSAHNTFIALNVQGVTGVGIRLGDCDNNCFTAALTPGGATIGVLVEDPILARSNYFYHLQASPIVSGTSYSFKVEKADSSPASPKNLIFGYDLANGQAQPRAFNSSNGEVSASGFLFWIDSDGTSHGES